jgi:hypothetical protein
MEPLIALLADLLNPAGGAAFEFGVILVFPGSGHILESPDLLKPAELFLSRLGEEFAPATFSDEAVDLGYQRFGNDNMGSPGAHLSPTSC